MPRGKTLWRSMQTMTSLEPWQQRVLESSRRWRKRARSGFSPWLAAIPFFESHCSTMLHILDAMEEPKKSTCRICLSLTSRKFDRLLEPQEDLWLWVPTSHRLRRDWQHGLRANQLSQTLFVQALTC